MIRFDAPPLSYVIDILLRDMNSGGNILFDGKENQDSLFGTEIIDWLAGRKFDFVISNPPYQDETSGDNKTFAPPVYNKIMDAAYRFVKDNSPIGTNSFDKTPEIFFENKPNDRYEYIKILGRVGIQRTYRWIRRDYVNEANNLDKWKI